MIGMVGTRKATDYGKLMTEKLVEDLAADDVVIVSGLAYGIDVCAHRAALKEKIPTIGVLAHGLDKIYPAEHRSVAKEMLAHGGLVTEFPSETKLDPDNFPARNRIVAGLVDALVVVESNEKGGALITAELANSYNRDVFAVPGDVRSAVSAGTHLLIKSNRAALIDSAADLRSAMGWSREAGNGRKVQKQLFVELNDAERTVLAAFESSSTRTLDSISIETALSNSKVAATLLELEFKGLVKALPGKQFTLT
jgi:DNA processing protein